jgi:signal transduction histidine kinase
VRHCVPLVVALILLTSAHSWTQGATAETISELRAMIDGQKSDYTVRGTVMRTGNPFFMQDRTGGMEVSTASSLASLRIGDELILTGTFTPARYSPRMRAKSVRVIAAGVPPPAVSATAIMLAAGYYDRFFVETEGVLLRRYRAGNDAWMVLRSGNETFLAQLPATLKTSLSEDIQTGSTIRVRGICLMQDGAGPEPVPFSIVPRSAEDLRVVAPPPFWNVTHITELVLCVMAVGLALAYAYIRVQRWRFETVLRERTRMAHDLHDTLAQSFGGIAFQLQAVRNSFRAGDTKLDSHLDMAVGMVTHCQEDARKAIAMLRPADLDSGNLLENLRQQAEALTRGGDVTFVLTQTGVLQKFPSAVDTALLRIGHEAITNAIRHAQPSQIEIYLDITARDVTLSVRDDGCGFNLDSRSRRGFGLHAMHARATSQGGTLRMLSTPEGGTSVAVTLPLNRRKRNPLKLLSRVWEESI